MEDEKILPNPRFLHFVIVAIVLTIAGLLLLRLVPAQSNKEAASGFDPASRAFLLENFSQYKLQAGRLHRMAFRFDNRGRKIERAEQRKRQLAAAEMIIDLGSLLQAGQFEIMDPIEKSEAISDLPFYLSMKGTCENFEEVASFGVPRQLNYEEVLYEARPPGSQASAGFALYKLDEREGTTFFALRAEGFPRADESKSSKFDRQELLKNSAFSIFSMPDCRWLGHFLYNDRKVSSKASGDFGEFNSTASVFVERSYIAEIVSINGQPYVVDFHVQATKRRKGQHLAKLRLWDPFADDGPFNVYYTYAGTGSSDHMRLIDEPADLLPVIPLSSPNLVPMIDD